MVRAYDGGSEVARERMFGSIVLKAGGKVFACYATSAVSHSGAYCPNRAAPLNFARR